ncbi:hypothetical protein [Jeotgalibaca porci]|uniref:hypothetical protein n=1 Tax=Jeotgalibaca porci TaxID=1868793 RepID=UPI0035A05D66
MITKLAIWWLRKANKSVVINYVVTQGELQAKQKQSFIYDIDFADALYKDCDGEIVALPSGKFTMKRG